MPGVTQSPREVGIADWNPVNWRGESELPSAFADTYPAFVATPILDECVALFAAIVDSFSSTYDSESGCRIGGTIARIRPR
jgi:hypothetical protein